jgi:hypothetical protein
MESKAMNYPTFARIRANRAARQIRGVVIPFPCPDKAEPAPMSWSELVSVFYCTWANLFTEVMRQAALSDLDGEDTPRGGDLVQEFVLEM